MKIAGQTLFIGTKIVVPEPQEDDTWSYGMITEIDDIYDNDVIVFNDDEYEEHEIDISRIQVLK